MKLDLTPLAKELGRIARQSPLAGVECSLCKDVHWDQFTACAKPGCPIWTKPCRFEMGKGIRAIRKPK